MSSPGVHRSGIRVGHSGPGILGREKAGCEERAALSEELADLQASRDEEIRRLTELFRTGCRPPATQESTELPLYVM